MAKSVKTAAKKAGVKKNASGKISSKKQSKTIKYSDKSTDQPELVPIFNEIRKMLLGCVKGTIKIQEDSAGQIHLYSKKQIEVSGKKRDEIYFASAMVQKGYVGFYLMPVYSDVFLVKEIAPELLKCLKGKSCFHIKKLDETLKGQIQNALEAGYSCFEKKGWV